MKYIYFSCLLMFFHLFSNANNMLVQNVTTLNDNPSNKTIQVQFDLSWDNSWRDSINWDAVWIFLKFKDANGLWQHAKLNVNGFQNGSGTSNTVQVTSDKVGAWVYRNSLGSGTFNSTNMQLQWNYGLSGLTKVTGLEVRVFAVEMVYVPEGDFNIAKGFYCIPKECCGSYSFNGSLDAPASIFPVINNRLSPTLNYSDGTFAKVRIKGDVGIDTNNDGVIDNMNYPIGYRAFYCFKYELTNQQYADFLNTLTTNQISTLGTEGINVILSNGQYFTSNPNQPCSSSNNNRLYSFADWSGLRPMSYLEFNKSCYGPKQPVFYSDGGCSNGSYPAGGQYVGEYDHRCFPIKKNVGYLATSSSTRQLSGASYYGIMDLTGVNMSEPVIKLNYFEFSSNNGDGVLNSNGTCNISIWVNTNPIYIDQSSYIEGSENYGFRYVRSAE